MQQISRLEDMSSLDRVVTPVQRLARMVRPQRVRDALHGVWLGHPLHPVLVQAPVGAYLSAAVLSDGCLTCPWHGSMFRIHDGAVVHGPATAPQPVFRTRIQGATVQACLPGAG